MTKHDIYRAAIKTAREDLKIAQQNFNYADSSHIDVAIKKLMKTEKKLERLIRRAASG